MTACANDPMNTTLWSSVLVACLTVATADGGDRQPGYNYTFPPDFFHRNGGGELDVTRAPFKADPAPSRPGREHDDTAALVAAYNFVVDKVRTHGYDSADSQWVIYRPDGVYDVSDTITYSIEPPLFYKRHGMIYLRMWGQSRDETVIRLKDNSPGFEAGRQKVVLSYHKHKGTNAETVNSLENLTVDTGSVNPGAIGIQYVAAHEGRVRNLLIRSGDGRGSVGLYFPHFSVQGTFHDITIDGFDYGVRAVHEHEVNPCIEHLTLRKQRVAGIEVVDGTVFIRNLDSHNACPAVRLDGRVGQVVLIDSELAGGASDQAAIEMAGSGAMFVRNVCVDGFRLSKYLRRLCNWRWFVCVPTYTAVIVGLLRPSQAEAPQALSPRNIILIMADDLGYHSLSVYGCDEFQTPNLDRLAPSGMVFTQCHARAMCSPTRTVLLGDRILDRASMGVVPKHSMAEVLTANGLRCGFSGKWMQRYMPWNHGFAEGLVQVNWYK